MIEIIREEDWDSTTNSEDRGDSSKTAEGENRIRKETLPKDIKQIGRPDIGDRIYIEDQVYHFIHPFENEGEKIAYVLLGRFENYAGRQCTFIEAAIRLDEVEFEGDLPLWSDHTWAYIYKQLKKEHDSMVIVGWVMDIKGQLPNMTVRLEALHQKNFGGIHQVLFLMDTLEGEEAFYASRNGHLYRREGFYIYYDKNIPSDLNMAMQELRNEQGNAMGDVTDSTGQEIEKTLTLEQEPEETYRLDESETLGDSKILEESALHDKTPLRRGNYRRQIIEKEEKQPVSSYASSLVLLAVVCVLGVTAFQNYKKMNAMEETLAKMNPVSNVAATEQISETESMGIKVESVAGNVQVPENQPETSAQGESDTNPIPEDGTQQTPPDSQEAQEAPADTATDGTSTDVPVQPQTENPQGASTEAPQPADTQSESAPAAAEAQTYLNQGYYIVQKGDSLVGICRKIYQTTAMMDKLCEVNGIENKDAIFAGQYLTLPN